MKTEKNWPMSPLKIKGALIAILKKTPATSRDYERHFI
jgi:hypothetical protein